MKFHKLAASVFCNESHKWQHTASRQQQGKWQKKLGSKHFTWQIAAWKRDQNANDRKLGYSILAQKNHGKNSALGAAKQIKQEWLWGGSSLQQKAPQKGPAQGAQAKTCNSYQSTRQFKRAEQTLKQESESKAATKLKSKAADVTSTPLRSFKQQIHSPLTACLDCKGGILKALKKMN